jgi:amidohydrolase
VSVVMPMPTRQYVDMRLHKTLAISVFMLAAAFTTFGANPADADSAALEAEVRKRAAAVEQKLIGWRRDIHQHPELGDQETRTSKLVADHLRGLGVEVRTGVARTGVIGLLKGGKPGAIVALRADMDALPVKEPEGLPFASKAKQQFRGKEAEVMHACGHDTHTAMLMAVAEVLAGLTAELPGTVMFIFQPAEEGSSLFAPASGKTSGAKLMLEEGLFEKTKPAAIFGMHAMVGAAGDIAYRSGPILAASDAVHIDITGKQGHGGMPWNTIDAISTSALAISGLQTVVSRRADLTTSPAVLTIGTINGGSAANIVAEKVSMSGTLRVFDEGVRTRMHSDIRLTATKIAESAGAKAEVSIFKNYDATINDPKLTERMVPALQRAADSPLKLAALGGASEDFSAFATAVPGFYSSWASLRAIKIPRRPRRTTARNFSSMRARSSSALGPWPPWR